MEGTNRIRLVVFFVCENAEINLGFWEATTCFGEAFSIHILELIQVDTVSVIESMQAIDELGRPDTRTATEIAEIANLQTSIVVGFLASDKGEIAFLGSATKSDFDTRYEVFIHAALDEIDTADLKLAFDETEASSFDQLRSGPPFDVDPNDIAQVERLATWGYWRCVAWTLRCELISFGALGAFVFIPAGCGSFCVSTALTGPAGWLACLGCISAASAGTYLLVEEALSCWNTGIANGCYFS